MSTDQLGFPAVSAWGTYQLELCLAFSSLKWSEEYYWLFQTLAILLLCLLSLSEENSLLEVLLFKLWLYSMDYLNALSFRHTSGSHGWVRHLWLLSPLPKGHWYSQNLSEVAVDKCIQAEGLSLSSFTQPSTQLPIPAHTHQSYSSYTLSSLQDKDKAYPWGMQRLMEGRGG